jgi:hypothetical protein
VLEAEAKLSPQQLEAESQAWQDAAVDAYFLDLEEYFRAKAPR